jgi:hypothetical protein
MTLPGLCRTTVVSAAEDFAADFLELNSTFGRA